MNNNYFVGLDMGTNSVGWAVTDSEYNLIRKKGKDMWGSRMFKGADTAQKRRSYRTSRRRLARKRARIGYVREVFSEEIEKIDPGFYQRMDDSKYYLEDKNEMQKFAIFSDGDFTDKDYYDKFPTIYHLQKELISNEDPHDVRLVYLAVLNIFKHRGHFLNLNVGEDSSSISYEEYLQFVDDSRSVLGINLDINGDFSWLEPILSDKTISNSEKHSRIINQRNLDKKKNKIEIEMWKLVCGLTVKLNTMYPNDNYDEDSKKITINFRDGSFDETLSKLESLLEEQQYELILELKRIHDWGVLSSVLKGHDYLCEARIEMYNKHASDLHKLKRLIQEYGTKEQYDDMFRKMGKNNYSAYVGSVNSKKEKENKRRGKERVGDVNELYKMIKNMIKDYPDNIDKEDIIQDIATGNFLPKQLTSSNGVIPYQVHKKELVAILNNAEKYLPFLRQEDESGLTASERLVQMFEFNIPYYIGPYGNGNNQGSKNSWTVRKEFGKVYPWNFEEKIDVKVSAEKFIDRLVKHCTYLSGETVLPKNSLLYEKFMVLNELNNLKLNGDSISVELKQKLFLELFNNGKKVTANRLKDYLIRNGIFSKDEEIDISGIDKEFVNKRSNYAKFAQGIFNVEDMTYEQEQMSENIIFWSTVYSDSKRFLKDKIVETYGDKLSDKQIKRILGYKFMGWGRLSKQFLTLEGENKETGEVQSIISALWTSNDNLMQILSHKYSYIQEIESRTNNIEKDIFEIEYDDLEDLYISSPVKRMTWQTILILRDIIKVMGGNYPSKVFVEMARSPELNKTRKNSRKSKFEALYKGCKDDGRDWFKEIKNTDDSEFRRKKLFLYYTQKGRCMYTGEPIDLDELFNNNLYDIDHIYPRHFIKDDSIENNLVLVKKENNANKTDKFPLESSIQSHQHAFWKSLMEGGFITKEKYSRLIRVEEFTDEEKAAFINRQLVETRQGTKVISNIITETCQNSEIVYVKAGNVSDFRKQFEMIKCRDVNDLHHAKDAYLNIVVGNVYDTKFTKNPLNFIKNEYDLDRRKNHYNLGKMYQWNVERNGNVAWCVDNNKSISTVKKMMSKNTPLLTHMSHKETGRISKQMPVSAKEIKKGNKTAYLQMKGDDTKLSPEKYGGLSDISTSYLFLVEHTKKNKRELTLEMYPVYLANYKNSNDDLIDYCVNQLKYNDPEIKLSKINLDTLFKINGYFLYITGKTGNQYVVSNGKALCLSSKKEEYIKYMSDQYSFDKTNLENNKLISYEMNISLYDELKEISRNSYYVHRPNSLSNTLENGRGLFIELDITNQIGVLLQILKTFQYENLGYDLTKIGGKGHSGKMLIGKNISSNNEFKIISQSATGLYRKEIDLLNL